MFEYFLLLKHYNLVLLELRKKRIAEFEKVSGHSIHSFSNQEVFNKSADEWYEITTYPSNNVIILEYINETSEGFYSETIELGSESIHISVSCTEWLLSLSSNSGEVTYYMRDTLNNAMTKLMLNDGVLFLSKLNSGKFSSDYGPSYFNGRTGEHQYFIDGIDITKKVRDNGWDIPLTDKQQFEFTMRYK